MTTTNSVLVDLARSMIEQAKVVLQMGLPVLPCFVTETDDSASVYGVMGQVDPEAFEAFRAAMVRKDGAYAALTFSDAHERDDDGNVVGDCLLAVVETAAGETTLVRCSYRRDPLRFGDVEVVERPDAMPMTPTAFGRTNPTTTH